MKVQQAKMNEEGKPAGKVSVWSAIVGKRGKGGTRAWMLWKWEGVGGVGMWQAREEREGNV
jgi:hypothetical protein